MRILLVSHNYPPNHTAGVEQHAAQTARELLRRGHEVSVFTAEKDISRSEGVEVDREHDGVPVRELTNNLVYDDFRQTWKFERAERAFAAHLDRVKPDVVHFQHLMHLSVGCVGETARRGAATVFTLHDYWVQCARFGQRLHPDGSTCERIDFARCGECMSSFKFRQSKLERSTGRWIAGLKDVLGVDLSVAAKRAARSAGLATSAAAPPDAERIREMTEQLVARDAGLRAELLANVRRFIAPSRFLLQRMLEWGIPSERIELMRMGGESDRFDAHPRSHVAGAGDGPLRVLFLGTFAPHKAPHLIVEAWERLPAQLRARAELVFHGSGAHYPDYVEAFKRAAGVAGAHVRGVLARDAISAELARTDLLVMPSVWWENAPLVLIEAVAARTPILVSNFGGMAEFVDERSCGETFVVGDSADLARSLQRLLEEPRLLSRFYQDGIAPPTMPACVDRLEQIYAEARAGR